MHGCPRCYCLGNTFFCFWTFFSFPPFLHLVLLGTSSCKCCLRSCSGRAYWLLPVLVLIPVLVLVCRPQHVLLSNPYEPPAAPQSACQNSNRWVLQHNRVRTAALLHTASHCITLHHTPHHTHILLHCTYIVWLVMLVELAWHMGRCRLSVCWPVLGPILRIFCAHILEEDVCCSDPAP